MPLSGRAYVWNVDLVVKIRNDNGMSAILLKWRSMDFLLKKTRPPTIFPFYNNGLERMASWSELNLLVRYGPIMIALLDIRWMPESLKLVTIFPYLHGI